MVSTLKKGGGSDSIKSAGVGQVRHHCKETLNLSDLLEEESSKQSK